MTNTSNTNDHVTSTTTPRNTRSRTRLIMENLTNNLNKISPSDMNTNPCASPSSSTKDIHPTTKAIKDMNNENHHSYLYSISVETCSPFPMPSSKTFNHSNEMHSHDDNHDPYAQLHYFPPLDSLFSLVANPSLHLETKESDSVSSSPCLSDISSFHSLQSEEHTLSLDSDDYYPQQSPINNEFLYHLENLYENKPNIEPNKLNAYSSHFQMEKETCACHLYSNQPDSDFNLHSLITSYKDFVLFE